jgi:hypothetical protein
MASWPDHLPPGNQKRFWRRERINAVNFDCLLLCGTRVSLIADSFHSERAAVLNVGSGNMILVEENVVQLPLIDHLSAPALIEVPFLRFAQLVKVSGVHSLCHSFHLSWWFHLFNCENQRVNLSPTVSTFPRLFSKLTARRFLVERALCTFHCAMQLGHLTPLVRGRGQCFGALHRRERD